MGGLLPLLGMLAAAVLVCDCSPQQIRPCESDKINFLSFFPCTDSEPQRSLQKCDVFLYPAAQLAVKHINQHPRMLKYQGFNNTLNLIPTGTRGDVHFTTFFHAQHVGPELPLIHGIIGPDDSVIAERTAYISGNYFQTHMISYGARDPSLSDSERYPLFYRSLPSGLFLDAGIVALLKMFGWKRIAVLASVEERFYTKTGEQLVQMTLEQHQDLRVEFYGNIGDNLHFVFKEILAVDLRIIIGLFSQEVARRLLCEANRFNSSLTDSSHVWLLLDYYNPVWWRLSEEERGRLHLSQGNCTNQEVADILESVLFLDSFNYNIASNEHDPSNLSLQDFHEQLLNWTVTTHPSLGNSSNLTAYLLHSHASAAYDAVWALALAWNETTPKLIFEEDICSMTNLSQVATATARVLRESLHAAQLCGIAGPQMFNVSYDTFGQILISQFINGSTQPVGIFQSTGGGSGKNAILEQFVYLHDTSLAGLEFIQPALSFQWKGRPDNAPPSDGAAVERSQITLPALGVVTVLVVLAVAFSAALLLLNIYYRENRHIKASSPRLNILIIAGFMLVPPSAVLRGLIISKEYYGISASVATALCQVELHVTNTALTVAVATLFAKNWRIYRIFHNQQMQMLSWILSDNGLLLMVLLMTLPFVSLLAIWQIVDPVVSCQRTFVSATRVLELSCCGSESYLVWLWLCIAYTALMMLALLVISFHNSTTASQFMEEGNSTAKFAMLHLLLVLPALLLTIVILHLESSLYTFSFWLSVVWLVVLPVTLLTILYMPKFICVYKDHRDKRKQTVEEARTTVMRTRLHSLHEESSKLKLELEKRESRVRLLSQSYSETATQPSPQGAVSPQRAGGDS